MKETRDGITKHSRLVHEIREEYERERGRETAFFKSCHGHQRRESFLSKRTEGDDTTKSVALASIQRHCTFFMIFVVHPPTDMFSTESNLIMSQGEFIPCFLRTKTRIRERDSCKNCSLMLSLKMD
jgi:hypothetical protein